MTDAIVGVTGVTAVGGTNDEYEFTTNWFEYGALIWSNIIEHLPKPTRPRRFMEIGSFEGRSAVWMIENMMKPGDSLYCVDTWEGGAEHKKIDMEAVERRFDKNILTALAKTGVSAGDIHKIKGSSLYTLAHQLRWLPTPSQRFDFIYIDGSHEAPDVLTDAVLAWPLLHYGGIMVFDDYLWGDPRLPLGRPKIAIDAFMNIFGGEINVMHISYQVVIKKTRLP